MDNEKLIFENTCESTPYLCPEIRLRLVTETCPLWRAREHDLTALGISDPFWAFCWAGGQALARFLLDHPEVVAGKRVLDFGAGGAVEGIAAALAGAREVLAADIDPLTKDVIALNAKLNGVNINSTCDDLVGTPVRGFDVVLAGDVCYDPKFAEKVIVWLRRIASAGIQVFIGDPGRGYLPDNGLVTVATYRAPADVDLSGKFLRDTRVFKLEVNE
jgi:predicted nicotinamide N-methyase